MRAEHNLKELYKFAALAKSILDSELSHILEGTVSESMCELR